MKSVVGQMAKQEQTLLESRPDVTELADEDLANVTGAWGGYYGYGYHHYYHHHYYHRHYYKKYGYGYGYGKGNFGRQLWWRRFRRRSLTAATTNNAVVANINDRVVF